MPNIGFIQAAYEILKQEARPLSAEVITKQAFDKGLIMSKGKTPVATMSARLYMDIQRKVEASRFVKIKRGIFGLREWQKEQKANEPKLRPGSFKAAAYAILKAENKPLNVETITGLAQKRELLSTKGQTPQATMGAQIYTDIKTKKDKSPFIQLGKNKFGLKEWGIDVILDEIEEEEKKKVTSRTRSIVGDPINFEGLIYGPLNENGVIFLFSKLHDKLGINIEAIQASYPDAKGRRKISKGWEDIWIEFEYKSSSFKQHKHDPKDCDLIICWEHDWKDCPLEVIELKSVIEKLRNK